MGRMIDPYLLEDKDEQGKWWCFYKQNGVSMSYSHDLRNWTFFGHAESGENVSVLNERDEYILFHSPSNGISIKRSSDLQHLDGLGKADHIGSRSMAMGKRKNYGGHGHKPKKRSEGWEISNVFSWFWTRGPRRKVILTEIPLLGLLGVMIYCNGIGRGKH